MNTPEPELYPGIAGIIGTVRFGIKTGANNFFYLTPERIKELGIEIEFLAPVMPSPTENGRNATTSGIPARAPRAIGTGTTSARARRRPLPCTASPMNEPGLSAPMGKPTMEIPSYEVHCDDGVADAIADELNGDFAQVQYNIEGRANFGGGALELTREELAKIRIASISTEGGGTSFTERERQAPEAALRELVNHRRRRARSA